MLQVFSNDFAIDLHFDHVPPTNSAEVYNEERGAFRKVFFLISTLDIGIWIWEQDFLLEQDVFLSESHSWRFPDSILFFSLYKILTMSAFQQVKDASPIVLESARAAKLMAARNRKGFASLPFLSYLLNSRIHSHPHLETLSPGSHSIDLLTDF